MMRMGSGININHKRIKGKLYSGVGKHLVAVDELALYMAQSAVDVCLSKPDCICM
jgi:hypothetical protein